MTQAPKNRLFGEVFSGLLAYYSHGFHNPHFGRRICSTRASMTLVLAAKPGLSMEMSQTKQEEQDAAPVKPTARKRWELFWRIIAGLMLLVIVWIVWVLYQITPRSVVTPLVYESQVKPIGTQRSATSGAAAGASRPPAAAPPGAHQAAAAASPVREPTPAAAAAAAAMDEAQ
ncbi:MAG: hypothetical protein Q8Q16_08290, partial [Betaproteobacteria bacterium]|nr:hypothetical protein [Betaproteobacteria bacterium]